MSGEERADRSTPIDYFDRMYEEPDPWGYESSWYEQRKYSVTMASLPAPRYRRAFEPGCSIGVLSAQLAARCDELISWDFHRATAARARNRLQGCAQVTVGDGAVPNDWPPGSFDLVVLSEVAYYLDVDHHERLIDRVAETVGQGGDVVLVHWRGETDYPQAGDAIHDRWRADPRFDRVVEHREGAFRLDVVRRRRDAS